MGITVRILMSVIILFYCIEGSLAQTVHDVVTYTTKSVEELKCTFTPGFVLWAEQRDDRSVIILFSYDGSDASPQKRTNDSKYDNFNYSVKGTRQFNLLIKNVDKHDGGRYQCITQPTLTFDVVVEVLPASISMNCTKSSAEIRKAAPYISCTCVATGLSSNMVDIEWKGASTFSTDDPTRTMENATGTFIIRREITLPSPNWNSSVSCSLTGFQSQIPERLKSFNYTFLRPVCTLMHSCSVDNNTALLTCNCRGGFPEVNTFWFYDSKKSVIATQSSNIRHVEVEPNRKETFYCSGSNEVDQIVELEFRCQQGTMWWIFIIIGVIAVTVVVAFWKIRSKVGKNSCCRGPKKPPSVVPHAGNGQNGGLKGPNDPLLTPGNQEGRTRELDPDRKKLILQENEGRATAETDVESGEDVQKGSEESKKNASEVKPPCQVKDGYQEGGDKSKKNASDVKPPYQVKDGQQKDGDKSKKNASEVKPPCQVKDGYQEGGDKSKKNASEVKPPCQVKDGHQKGGDKSKKNASDVKPPYQVKDGQQKDGDNKNDEDEFNVDPLKVHFGKGKESKKNSSDVESPCEAEDRHLQEGGDNNQGEVLSSDGRIQGDGQETPHDSPPNEGSPTDLGTSADTGESEGSDPAVPASNKQTDGDDTQPGKDLGTSADTGERESIHPAMSASDKETDGDDTQMKSNTKSDEEKQKDILHEVLFQGAISGVY